MNNAESQASPHINQMRTHLMGALASLCDRANPMEPDRARAMAQVASVLVDSAKVEVEYLKATGQDRTSFLEQPVSADVLRLESGNLSAHDALPNGIASITRHHLRG